MLLDAKKIFDSFYKKNKSLTVVIVFLVAATLADIVVYEISKTVSAIDSLQSDVARNSSRINSVSKKMVTQDMVSRDIVKRVSFNAYIKRKDEEYHEQVSINNLLSSKVGFIEGQLDVFKGFFNSFSFLNTDK